ncbi:hypothetical protein QTL86_22470 [Cellulosilyticum sp. ST5]|uniref:hypothetical protein n=1 Tax=Cellulosilyticum sp. ST5 TaxID=3055805 RepID=UPI003977727F
MISKIKGLLVALIIIVGGGSIVTIGATNWMNRDRYLFVAKVIGTVHIEYPELDSIMKEVILKRDNIGIKAGNRLLQEKGYIRGELEGFLNPSGIAIEIIILGIVVLIISIIVIRRIAHTPIRKNEYLPYIGAMFLGLLYVFILGIGISQIFHFWKSDKEYVFISEVVGTIEMIDRNEGYIKAEKIINTLSHLEHEKIGIELLESYGYSNMKIRDDELLMMRWLGIVSMYPLAIYCWGLFKLKKTEKQLI